MYLAEEINFNDSITQFLAADTLGQLIIESQRVKKSGLDHKLIFEYYEYLVKNHEIILQNREIDKKNEVINTGNSAIQFYNNAIVAYNKYIKAKNSQFRKPILSDDKVRQLIIEPDNLLLNSELLISALHPDDLELKNLVGELRIQLKALREAIDAEKRFVDRYVSTAKPKRMSLFLAY